MANIFRKRNSIFDDSRGTSTQFIVNHMEREEERYIMGGDKRNSVHSDWSDLMSIDEEAEYRKIYKNRKRPNTTSTATTLAASATKAAIIPSASPAKKTVKTLCWCLIHQGQKMGKLVHKVTICFKYCCKPTCSAQTIKSRTEGRRIRQGRRGKRIGL